MIRKQLTKKKIQKVDSAVLDKNRQRRVIAEQIKKIVQREIKKGIQTTKQNAKGRPLKDFPKTPGKINDFPNGFWAARLIFLGKELIQKDLNQLFL